MQVILKGIESGQIRFPFNRTVKADGLTAEQLESTVKGTYLKSYNSLDILREIRESAKLDAFYVKMLYAALTEEAGSSEQQ